MSEPEFESPPPFSWVYCGISAWIINFVVNFLIGWVLPPAPMPIWGVMGSFASELIGTAFGVAFVTSLIATPQTRSAVAKGKMIGPRLSERWHDHFANWPRLGIVRAFMVGFATVLAFIPVSLICLYLLEPAPLDRLDVAFLKALFGAVVGGLVTPVIVAAATVAPKPKRRQSEPRVSDPVPSDGESLPKVNP